jgi:hypothetical protein
VGHGIVVAPALPLFAEAGVDLRLLALWYVEFVLLRFQDYRDEYPSATAPATLATSRRCRGWRRSAQAE